MLTVFLLKSEIYIKSGIIPSPPGLLRPIRPGGNECFNLKQSVVYYNPGIPGRSGGGFESVSHAWAGCFLIGLLCRLFTREARPH